MAPAEDAIEAARAAASEHSEKAVTDEREARSHVGVSKEASGKVSGIIQDAGAAAVRESADDSPPSLRDRTAAPNP